MKRIVVAGGSGYLGGVILRHLKEAGYETSVVSRGTKSVPNADRVVTWSGLAAELEGAYGVINLCGSTVARAWTEAVRKDILESRLVPTSQIAEAVASCANPPKVWLNASGINFAGDTGSKIVTEASNFGPGFLGELTEKWESGIFGPTLKTRRAAIRIGFVLGQGSAAFGQLSKVTQLFVGGAFGDGKQYISWIHEEDVARLFLWALEEDVNGPINACAPNPVSNGDMMAAFRAAYGRPPIPPAPTFMVKIMAKGMGVDSSLLLDSCRAQPEIALSRGFRFKFETIEAALLDLVKVQPMAWKSQDI